MLVLILGLIIVLVWYLLLRRRRESFQSPEDRAQTLSDWFVSSGSSASYQKYIREVDDGDVVEYSAIGPMFAEGKHPSLGEVANKIKTA